MASRIAPWIHRAILSLWIGCPLCLTTTIPVKRYLLGPKKASNINASQGRFFDPKVVWSYPSKRYLLERLKRDFLSYQNDRNSSEKMHNIPDRKHSYQIPVKHTHLELKKVNGINGFERRFLKGKAFPLTPKILDI